MLVRVAVDAEVTAFGPTPFRWLPEIEFSLDCFICRRVRRTVIVKGDVHARACTVPYTMQTNLVYPVRDLCRSCGEPLAAISAGPVITPGPIDERGPAAVPE